VEKEKLIELQNYGNKKKQNPISFSLQPTNNNGNINDRNNESDDTDQKSLGSCLIK
jgi:hypothetical protein